ncbi:MAG: hypothetical protein RLP44_16480 [Aggregatilineales bacterium]
MMGINFDIVYSFALSLCMIISGVIALKRRKFSIDLGIGRAGGPAIARFGLEGTAGIVAGGYCISMGIILLIISLFTIIFEIMSTENLMSVSIAMGFLTLFGILIVGFFYKFFISLINYGKALGNISEDDGSEET